MKYLCFLTCFIAITGYSQTTVSHSLHADTDSSLSTSKQLAAKLTEGLINEKDKVRAIFLWVTDNIDYRTRTSFAGKSINRYKKQAAAENISMNTLDEQVAEIVLRDKQAVCDGYSRLFKTLCSHAGVKSEVITGYARGYSSSSKNYFISNHSWNAVYLDSTWQLLDVTWASGYLNYRNEYVRRLDDSYYLVKPEQFIKDHFPDDFNWALVNEVPTLKEFSNTPFKPKGFLLSKIDSYFPGQGIIEARIGETITVELRSNLHPLKSPPNYSIDYLQLSEKSVALTKPSIKGNKLTYNFRVNQPGVEWLHIYYNEEEVMRYRLKVITD